MLSTSCMSGQVVFDEVVVEYGGQNGFGSFYLFQCDASISNSTVTDSSTYGVYRTGTTVIPVGMTYANNTLGDLF